MPKKNTPETVTFAKRLVIESLPKCLKLLDLNEIIELLINILDYVGVLD